MLSTTMKSAAMAAGCLLFATTSVANVDWDKLTLNPNVTYGFFGQQYDLENRPHLGLGLGYALSDDWTVSLDNNWLHTRRRTRNQGEDGFRTSLNFIKHFSTNTTVQPLAFAGLGYLNLDSDTEPHDLFTLDFGVGVDYPITERAALRLTASDLYTTTNDEHNALISAGFVVKLGHKAETHRQVIAESEPTIPAHCEEMMQAQLQTVYFENDSSLLGNSAIETLEEVAGCVSYYPDVKLLLSGHASLPGRMGYNQALSQRRADAVAKQLSDFGVAPSRLVISAHGALKPQSEQGQNPARDRRVEIKIEGEKAE